MKQQTIRHLIRMLCLCAVMIPSLLEGQGTYRFRNYTIADGLSQSSVTTILQDKYGTLWFGTQDGLNRFDGQGFEVFHSDNTPGMVSAYFYTSFKDRKGSLWFGTSNGLIEFNPRLETFRSHLLKDGFALQIETIAEDQEGNLWLGTSSNGICVFNKKEKKFNFFIAPLASSRITFIQFTDRDHLLVSTEDKGLYLIHTKSKSIREVVIRGKLKTFVRTNVAVKHGDKNWILGTNQGLYSFNPETRLAKPYLKKLDEELGQVEVTDIFVAGPQQLFLGTKGQGLINTYQKNGYERIHQYTQDIFQRNALVHNAINKIFRDKSGTFWVATERGIGSFNPYEKGFNSIEPSGDMSKGIPTPSVWCFAEYPKTGHLFIGTDNAISRRDPKTGKFDQFLRNKGDGGYVENYESSILSMSVINQAEVLVGTTEGLYQLSIQSANQYSYRKIEYKGISNPSNFDRTYHIIHWKDNYYFLATKGGVLLYDKSNGTFKVFEHNPLDSRNTISAGICRFAYKDWSGNLWFTTSVGGLNKLMTDGNRLRIIPYRFNQTIRLLAKDYITSITQTDENTLWMGTLGSGMIEFNLRTKKANLYNKKNGLPNNVVYGILVDKDQTLWISTNKGIASFDTKTNAVRSFTELDGLVSTEFNLGAYHQSTSGTFYFGSINGYNFFEPSRLSKEKKYTDVVFTKIKLDANWLKPRRKGGILTRSISETKAIDLNYRQRSFTVKFMALDMSNPKLVTYKYLLEGSDEGEIQIGNSNQIHFNSLQPGDYKLKVYAKLGGGEWNPIPAELEIHIDAPFWRTVGFWVITAVIVALLIIIIARKRIEEERRQQVLLEMKIAERTREIREQNIKIEKQKQLIEEKKNHLEEQKRLLENEKEKTEKLLKNIIPESTYEELKTKGRASARAYKTVSVLFTDFVGFTKIAEKMNPSDLVNELDIYFRKFDEIIVRNNLEKIKTIGDAYMCAGGVPVRNNTNPIDACLAALQIQESMQIMREEAKKSDRVVWDLRLGINTGEVTAGVIGSEKLAYDIWGSTVNQAQRMEMLGEPGKVTVSGQTFAYIEPYFICTFKGKVKSKSKGLIDMYTVDGIKPELSVDGKGIYPNERFHQIVNLHHYSSINYYKAERHIMKILEKKLSPKLHYHSINHTKDVCRAVERLALLEGVTDEGLFLLKSAATYHDAGFVESYDKNEPVGARMAGEILPKYGYTEEHIEMIRKLIYVTQIPHQPSNKLEEIMCDADLDYLGTDEFHEIADKLRLELREHGKIDSDRKWDEIQISFLTQHKYFTETARKTRQAKKEQHLEEIKERLQRNEYKD